MSYKDDYYRMTWSSTSTTTDTSFFNTAANVFKVPQKVKPWGFMEEEAPPEGVFAGYLGQEMLVYYPRANRDYSADQTQSPGAVQFINVKDLLARFFVSTYFQNERVKNWRAKCIGITSMINPMSYREAHMPIFDYDGNVKKKIRADVAEFQDKYGLGDAWVYKTKKGYHVYFFCDQVAYDIYMQMLAEADCCEGFKKKSSGNGYSVLRVSAKYTKFDIELEYILKSKNTSVVKRPLRKAHIVQELLSLGQDCGTHFASMFPQWARFTEDPKEWRAPAKKKTRTVRRKSGSKGPISPQEILEMKHEMMYKGEKINMAKLDLEYNYAKDRTVMTGTTEGGDRVVVEIPKYQTAMYTSEDEYIPDEDWDDEAEF